MIGARHSLMPQSDWCKMHTLNAVIGVRYPNAAMIGAGCKPLCSNLIGARYIPKCRDLIGMIHTTLHANIVVFFIQKITKKFIKGTSMIL